MLPRSDLEVNALQRAAAIVVQKSLGEELGLVVAYYIHYLLTYPDIAQRLGPYGQLHNFLITSHLRRWLLLLIALDHPGERIVYP